MILYVFLFYKETLESICNKYGIALKKFLEKFKAYCKSNYIKHIFFQEHKNYVVMWSNSKTLKQLINGSGEFADILLDIAVSFENSVEDDNPCLDPLDSALTLKNTYHNTINSWASERTIRSFLQTILENDKFSIPITSL